MFRKDQATQTRDILARKTAFLDQLQASLDTNRDLLGEEQAWEFQAFIDAERFTVEVGKIALTAKISK